MLCTKKREKLKGNFTEGDKVILSALRDKPLADEKLKNMGSLQIHIFLSKVSFPKHSVQQLRMDIWKHRSNIIVYLRILPSIMRL